MSKLLPLTIVSDFACPWCLIGKRRLEQAIAQRPELAIEVDWQPFQLNPDMPREGINRWDYYQQKFGAERLSDLRETLANAGAESGIVFGNDPGAMAPNTLSAHVLMFWAAKDPNIDSNALAEKLFHAHHVDCENIGDHKVLARIAAEVGMDNAEVMAKLAAGDDEDKVKELVHQSAARGISGVPFFIVNEQYGISGAQSAASLVSAFDQALKTGVS